MSIFDRGRTAALTDQVRTLTTNTEALQTQVKHYQKVQETLVKDILTLQEVTRGYVGNDYRKYDEAVKEISSKFLCQAEWGCLQTQTIINLRAAFILGDGLRVEHTTTTRKEAERELQFVEDFRTFNDLDGELDREMAKEAEIEGKIAIRLYLDEEPYRKWPGMVSSRYISWLSKKYVITADPNDYLWYKTLTWPAGGVDPGGTIQEPNFVYAKFGGRISAPNEANPAIQGCLTQIDRLDRALRDLREIDHLFASPTPYFKCADKKEVEAITEYIETTNWKIGKAVTAMADFQLVSAPISGADTLIKEIELCVKLISGTTGIPIHYLGLLDLLHNRATGENTRELIMAATTRERKTWIGVYEELFTKAMILWNSVYAAQKSEEAQLDPTKIKVNIPQVTQEHWDHIERVLIPAAAANIISREHVATQIPGVDPEAEAERREEADAKEAERTKDEMRLLRDRMSGDDGEGEGDED